MRSPTPLGVSGPVQSATFTSLNFGLLCRLILIMVLDDKLDVLVTGCGGGRPNICWGLGLITDLLLGGLAFASGRLRAWQVGVFTQPRLRGFRVSHQPLNFRLQSPSTNLSFSSLGLPPGISFQGFPFKIWGGGIKSPCGVP